jgi:diaminopimelate decarboxylase/GNAT superfamily N-acetyltransferase
VPLNPELRSALSASTEDQIVFDLAGIEGRHQTLLDQLPGVAVRFALKSCPVDEVIATLAGQGAGCDAASPHEITQALRAGVPVDQIHYGNTNKSDQNIADAYALGVRDFATDSVEDVRAIAAHAPGARVFCRLATRGHGALWGLSRKFGCSITDAVLVLEAARAAGLVPAGLSVHVGSQQMRAESWRDACDDLAEVIVALGRRGIRLDHVNLGGGLPALGYLDRRGQPLDPPLDKIFATIRDGMQQLSAASESALDFVVEPGRHLVADHGAIRAHVSRLSFRELIDGERQYWLYLSVGKYNGLYEMDELQYRLLFPTCTDAEYVPAVVAGPTCDSDDAYAHEDGLVQVPKTIESGSPVWILSCGAYATSYTTTGFNGFTPLPYTTIRGARVRHIAEDDWDEIEQIEAGAYTAGGLTEGRAALESRARVSPETCFVVELGQRVVGYVLALPYPPFQYPDLHGLEVAGHESSNLHLHDMVISEDMRGRGLGKFLLHHLMLTARARLFERISAVAVGGAETFWSANGFHAHRGADIPPSYGADAVYLSRSVEVEDHGSYTQ